VLSYSLTAASPTPLKVSAPEAECVKEIGSASSSLLADPTPLDQFERVHLAPPPELKTLLSPAEADRLAAEPEGIKLCTYCGSEMVFARSFIGKFFCSSEHGELYLKEQIEKADERVAGGPEAIARALQGFSDSFSQNAPTAVSSQAEPISAQVSDQGPEKAFGPMPDNKELGAPEPRSSDETAMLKIIATAAGVVIGVSLLALIIGISLNFTRIALSSPQKAVSNARQRQNQPAQTLPAVPERLRTSAHTQAHEQGGTFKQFTGSSRQPASVDATKRVPSPGTVAPSIVLGRSRISIKANQGSWIDVCTDGRTVLRKYFPPLTNVNLGFSKDAVVRMGNSGGVEISINGMPAGPLGLLGEPRVAQFGVKGFRFLVPGDPGTECGR
jgi:hypothetical protein